MTAQHRIAPDILNILSHSAIVGNNLALPEGQLDRKTYEAVNKVLELMGGKWNRKSRAHVFEESPVDLLDTVLLTGEITDRKKLFQFFETPAALAERMVSIANAREGRRLLEPSAGNGAILRAAGGKPDKVAVELDPMRVRNLARSPFSGIQIYEADFLKCAPEATDAPDGYALGCFEVILMNPPFTRGQDVAHIRWARTFLVLNGTLVAICANGPRQREALMDECEHWEDLPVGTFSESGTNVNTALVVIRG